MNTTPGVLLLVEDDPSSLHSLADVLRQEGHEVHTAACGHEAVQMLDKHTVDLVLTDLRMRDGDGMHVLAEVKSRSKHLPVIVMTAFTSMETAIEAIRQGAHDYLSKPFKLDQLRSIVGHALEQSRLLHENQRLRVLVKEQGQAEVVGRSPEMVEIYKLVARVAPLPATVLIQGESGTGKEVIARLLHQNSGRGGPFMAINCGALAEGLLESELFGHAKGAFTGAVAAKTGILEAARGGTCFLDEIANTSPALQMKLLRVLEAREIIRVGTTDPVKINVRVIAASNQSLAGLVKSGKFREDLYYRLNVVTLQLPPLRQRRADIPLLLDHFVRMHALASGKEMAIHDSVYSFLSEYAWPGNVRELAHSVERAIALNASGVLTPQDFSDLHFPRSTDEMGITARKPGATQNQTLAEMEKEYIAKVVEEHGGNISYAAKCLDIDRRTIYRILQRQEP